MKDVIVKWTLPTVRESGQPLPIEDIGGTEVSISADGGANFSVLERVPADANNLLVPELETGYWVFRLMCFDLKGYLSLPVEKGWDDTAPGIVTDVSVTVA